MATQGGERLNLKWNNFQLERYSSFQLLREEEELFDLTLISGDGDQVAAHKLILAASSQFFRSILKNNPHPHPLIFLRGVRHKDLVFLLDFMYTGEVTVGQEELDSFLEAGEALGVEGLGAVRSPSMPGYEAASDDGQEKISTVKDVMEHNSIVKSEPEEGGGENIVELYEDHEIDFDGNYEEVIWKEESNVIVNPTSEQRKAAFTQYIKANIEEGKTTWECIACGKTDSYQSNLLRHAEKHMEKKHLQLPVLHLQ